MDDVSTVLRELGFLGAQGGNAFMLTWLIQKAKNVSWIPLTRTTDRLNSLVSVIVSFLATYQVSVVFNQDAGQLLITGLTLTNLQGFLVDVFKQYVLNDAVYHRIWKQPKVIIAGNQ